MQDLTTAVKAAAAEQAQKQKELLEQQQQQQQRVADGEFKVTAVKEEKVQEEDDGAAIPSVTLPSQVETKGKGGGKNGKKQPKDTAGKGNRGSKRAVADDAGSALAAYGYPLFGSAAIITERCCRRHAVIGSSIQSAQLVTVQSSYWSQPQSPICISLDKACVQCDQVY